MARPVKYTEQYIKAKIIPAINKVTKELLEAARKNDVEFVLLHFNVENLCAFVLNIKRDTLMIKAKENNELMESIKRFVDASNAAFNFIALNPANKIDATKFVFTKANISGGKFRELGPWTRQDKHQIEITDEKGLLAKMAEQITNAGGD